MESPTQSTISLLARTNTENEQLRKAIAGAKASNEVELAA
jgi:hypothetical protein